ncbi:MAG: SRPBCC family protein, partial [Gemmatimonadaceae bacterium]
MTQATSPSLRLSRVIRSDPDTLFRAWTDPKMLQHWWRMDGPGWSFAGASVDLRVGGSYRLTMTGPGGVTHVAIGEYRVIDRPTRLAFTWDWEDVANRVGD